MEVPLDDFEIFAKRLMERTVEELGDFIREPKNLRKFLGGGIVEIDKTFRFQSRLTQIKILLRDLQPKEKSADDDNLGGVG